jgi:hypothetical protein
MTHRYPANHRPPLPQLPDPGSRAGLPPLVLLAVCRADPRWQDRAEAVTAALAWEPPISTPRPLIEIPRHEILAGIGAWSRQLTAERLALKSTPLQARQSVVEWGEASPTGEKEGELSVTAPEPAAAAICEVCGQEFQARRNDAKLCSAKCRKRSSRRAAA